MAKSDNIVTVTLNKMVKLAKRNIAANIPFFLWSGPGIGKSTFIHGLAKSLGGIAIDLRLSQFQPTDLIGIPYPEENEYGKKVMGLLPMGLLPTEELASQYPIIVLFLDELNSAPPSVQAAAYQLVNDRRVGSYSLPKNVVVCAAGNHESDRGVTHRMASPLANRMSHYAVVHDYDSWLDWAITTKQHPDVVSFLSSAKDYLYRFEPAAGDKAFATPRSWEFVSKLLYTNTPDNPIEDDELYSVVAGAVGAPNAQQFLTYLKHGKNLPKPADILSGKVKKIETKEISAHYFIAISMLYELNELLFNNSKPSGIMVTRKEDKVNKRVFDTPELLDTFRKQLDNFFFFVLGNFEPEVGIMATKIACGAYQFLVHADATKLKSWTTLSREYGRYLVDSPDNN